MRQVQITINFNRSSLILFGVYVKESQCLPSSLFAELAVSIHIRLLIVETKKNAAHGGLMMQLRLKVESRSCRVPRKDWLNMETMRV